MGLSIWSPSRELATLREAMNRLFDDSFSRAMGTFNTFEQVSVLPIDVYTTDDDIVVTASVPGLDPESVTVTVEGDALTISGETPGRLENVSYLFCEQFHGKFSRTLKLNVPVDADRIEATFDKGVLTLVLPKAEAIKPKQIKVKTK